MATSFQRKTKAKVIQITGTKPSLHNNQLLVSTGVPSLDSILGGGLAVGTILLIEEDTYGSYSRMLMKYNLAEAVMCQHSILLACAQQLPATVLQELPGAVIDDPGTDIKSKSAPSAPQDQMDIAWRYQNLPQVQSAPKASKFGHYYDLTKTMDKSMIDATPQTLIDIGEAEPQCRCGESWTMNKNYQHVLQQIEKTIREGNFSTSVQCVDRSILRINLASLGSPLWGEEGGVHTQGSDPSLCRFLYALRAIMRTAFATCVVTIPTHLYQEPGLTSRLRHLCDTVIRLESFAGSDKEKNPAYKEYHGLLHIVKLPRLNSLTCHMPDTLDLAFKLRRKKFTIEKLHLPPDLSDTASRGDQEDPLKAVQPGMGCSTTHSKLDF